MTNDKWPGGTRRSYGNAFTHGYGAKPVDYVPGGPTKPHAPPRGPGRGGFGRNNGTMGGMGTPNAKRSA